jgi:hypothetical protein
MWYLAEIVAAVGAPIVLGALEGLRFRAAKALKRPDPTEGAEFVALKVAADEADIDNHRPPVVIAEEPERTRPIREVYEYLTEPTIDVQKESDELRAKLGAVGPQQLQEADDLGRAIRTQLADPSLRQALGLPRQPSRVSRIGQGTVTLGMVIFVIFSLATRTETGLAFAFMGSICGFWLREFSA